MVRNRYISETKLVDTVVKEISSRLPPRWLLLDRERGTTVRSPQESARRIDAIWELRDPNGLSTNIIVEVKGNPVEPRLVGSVASQLKALSYPGYEQDGANPANMLVSTYLSPLTRWLEPRGTRALFTRLRDSDIRYAVTGSFAAYRLAPIAEPRLEAVYVDEPDTAAQSLGLRPAETGGNVLLVIPFDPVAFERAEYHDGIIYARVTQVLLDLMKGPGRGPAEAEALQEWMRDNEDTWKQSMTETT